MRELVWLGLPARSCSRRWSPRSSVFRPLDPLTADAPPVEEISFSRVRARSRD